MKKDIFTILFLLLGLSIGAYNQPKDDPISFVEPVAGVERPSCVIAGFEAMDIPSIEENDEITMTNQYEDGELLEVNATAYYDERKQGHGADMRPLVEGLTVAGKVEWLGKTVLIFDENMEFLGYYEFRDTGYGRETGTGESKILPGKSIGTIECGQTIDIYFETYEKCMEWGKRKVYISIINAEG